MTNRHLGSTLLVVCLCALVSRPCFAEDKEMIKTMFNEGMALIDQENYPAALAKFKELYSIYPKVDLLYNIGMCQKALFKYSDALTTFKEYLEKGGEDIKPAMRADVEKAIVELDKMAGRLVLEGAPDQADVLINDAKVGATPLGRPFYIDPGRHALRVEKEGYVSVRMEIQVTSSEDTVVNLEKLMTKEEEEEAAEPEVTEQVPETETTVDKGGPSAMLIGGIIEGAVGVGGIVLGAVFAAKHGSNQDEGNKAAAANDTDKYEEYEDLLKKDKIGMGLGFGLGGALLVAGVVMIIIDVKKDDSGESDQGARVSPTFGGVKVTF